jgi:hypothetical protein
LTENDGEVCLDLSDGDEQEVECAMALLRGIVE